ncbi:MAG: hypothetical protein IJ848_00360 [Alphaproteobacteria bacterium]|nr:hypothetical protein [Alphaproteobacteria bacterium]
MNIFQDIHTYLIISFVLMLYILYKYAYRTADNAISSGINEIKNEIDQLHNKKKSLSDQIDELNSSILNEDKDMEKAIANAQATAEQIINNRNVEIQNIINEKREINTYNYKKLEDDINSRIRQKLTNLIVQKVIDKINTVDDVKNFQIINLQRSIDMLKSFTTTDSNK